MSRNCFPGCGCFGEAHHHWLPSTRRGFLRATACIPMLGSYAMRALAQERWAQGLDSTCSFYQDDVVETDVYTFGTNEEAVSIVKRIASVVGLEPNFDVLQANVPNAAAVIRGGKRYILYSQVFITRIDQQTAGQWAAWTIMAHEVGHHLNGHTLDSVGSRPTTELQADRFAGFAVGRMRGTLEHALSPYQMMSAQGSATHPPRSARLEAVTAGWNQARDQTPNGDAGPVPNTPPVIGQPEAILRQIIQEIQNGQTPQVAMAPQIQQAVTTQLQTVSQALRARGTISSARLQTQYPMPDGGTLYVFDVAFTSGATKWQLGIAPTGMITALMVQ